VVSVNKLSKSDLVLQIIICTALTCYIFQNVFLGLNFGDPMDGTLQMVLHEHWYKYIIHNESFLNTNFYYPFERAFGYSDVFLLQGPIYTVLRLIGAKMDLAWSITTFLIIYAGNIGWILVARNLLKNNVLKILFIVLSIFNYSFVAYVTSQPNAASYALFSYFIYFAIKIYQSYKTNKRQFNKHILYFVSLFSLMSLNNWYLTFFIGEIVLYYFMIVLILKLKRKRITTTLQELSKQFILKYLIISSLIIISMFSLFGYVYFPNRNDGIRNISDLISRSPVFKNIFNGSYPNDGGLFRSIYRNLDFIENKDNLLGVGLIYGVIFYLIIIQLIYRIVKICKNKNEKLSNIELIFVSIILSYFTFLVFKNELSIFSIFYELIPGLKSIRDTFRFNIILNYAILIYVFMYMDKRIIFKWNSRNIFITLFIFVLFVDQFRYPVKGWAPSIVENKGLNIQLLELRRNCDYFYFDAPGGWWYDQAVAMKFSAENGIPTTNGNSGAFPFNYPYLDFDFEGDISGMVAWISDIDPSRSGCITNGELPIFFLNSNLPRFDLESGFTGVESVNDSYWQWAISNKTYAIIYSPFGKDVTINFNVSSAKCNEGGSLKINTFQNEIITIAALSRNKTNVEYIVKMGNQKINKIEFTFDKQSCKIGNDTRELFFKISEYKLI